MQHPVIDRARPRVPSQRRRPARQNAAIADERRVGVAGAAKVGIRVRREQRVTGGVRFRVRPSSSTHLSCPSCSHIQVQQWHARSGGALESQSFETHQVGARPAQNVVLVWLVHRHQLVRLRLAPELAIARLLKFLIQLRFHIHQRPRRITSPRSLSDMDPHSHQVFWQESSCARSEETQCQNFPAPARSAQLTHYSLSTLVHKDFVLLTPFTSFRHGIKPRALRFSLKEFAVHAGVGDAGSSAHSFANSLVIRHALRISRCIIFVSKILNEPDLLAVKARAPVLRSNVTSGGAGAKRFRIFL